MRLEEFSSALNINVEDIIRIGETQVLNSSSKLNQSLRLEFAKKLAAVKAASDTEKKKNQRNRVYVQHVVSPADRYTFTTAFPQWDIRFSNNGLASASTARGVYTLMAEYLFQKVKTKEVKHGKVIAFGMDLRNVVMRSRDWVHLCVSGSDMGVQYDFLKQDRSVVAMVHASCDKGRDPGLALKYAKEEVKVHCTQSPTCKVQGIAGIGMFHKTDTNFRQIAELMHQHGLKLYYYMIPGGKNLEFCTQGELPSLDAYCSPSADGISMDIVYKNDYSLNHSYTYSNYLELVARTEVRMHGKVFRKEFDNSILGTLVYKVTCFPDNEYLKPADQVYRSWVEPEYRGQYMIYAPVVVPNGSVNNPDHVQMTTFPVPIDLVDEVHDYAMRAQGVKDMLGAIMSRLNSKTSTQILLYQIVQRNSMLVVSQFDLLVLVIFCSAFMQKYKDGQTMSTLAPHARNTAELMRHSTVGMFSAYAEALFSLGTSSLSNFITSVRKFYYETDNYGDLPLPAFLLEPGFVKYSDESSSNPRFKSWDTPDGNPTFGFSPHLPGSAYSKASDIGGVFELVLADDKSETSFVDPMMLATGEVLVSSQKAQDMKSIQKIKLKDIEICEEVSSVSSWMHNVSSYISGAFADFPDPEALTEDEDTKISKATNPDGFYEPKGRYRHDRDLDEDLKPRPKIFSESVDAVVNKVLNDNNRLGYTNLGLQTTRVFSSGAIPEVIPGAFSRLPIEDLRDGLRAIFPRTFLMNTEFFESDKLYGPLDFSLKGNKIKVDMSKLQPLKPEQFLLPVLRGHVQPNVKDTAPNVLYMLQKKTANTPDSAIPMDQARVIQSAWEAYLKVFCKPGTEEVLEHLPYIGPDEAATREWVSRLGDLKRVKLLGQDGFSTEDLNLYSNFMMMKEKLKPTLNASYTSSVKAPQNVQYDPSGKSTAAISPVVGRKGEREFSVLRSNVLVLQRKSMDDMVRFINQFDHRPDERGKRTYLEADQESFDKSQGPLACELHWFKCVKFGVFPDLVKFLREHNVMRTLSDVRAGVKAWLDIQRGSGHPDTLDANNDVNQMVLAELLLSIEKYIEFIIIQGDDIIVAVRGFEGVDISTWEYEVSRRYNLSVKLSVQEHGYICSTDVVHLPDGHSVLVADIIKKALGFLSMSKKDDDTLREQYISFVDSLRYVEDVRVQRYLSEALPKRMGKYLPNTTPEAILLICKALSKIKTSYESFRSMFADQATLRV